MRLFVDCEFNDFCGELISMALVSEAGDIWYEVVPCQDPSAWVAEHVIPRLGKEPLAHPAELTQSLQRFLARFDEVHVIADWPEDIQHFCRALITGPGMRINTPPLTMEVLRIDTVSAIPHNALADAVAIRDAVVGNTLEGWARP